MRLSFVRRVVASCAAVLPVVAAACGGSTPGELADPVPSAPRDSGADRSANGADDADPTGTAPLPGPPDASGGAGGGAGGGAATCAPCASGMVCCEAPLGCAGTCVPDCRNAPCPSGLTCDSTSGVCSPPSAGGGTPTNDGGSGAAPPPGSDAGAQGMMPPPGPDGGGAGMMPPPGPDGGGMRPPGRDAGGAPGGGGGADAGTSADSGSGTPAGGIGVIAGSGGVKIPYSGNNVSTDGTTILLGDSNSACYSGLARAYVWDGVSSWQMQQEIDDPDPTSPGPMGTTSSNLNCFGGSTAVHGATAFVGAPEHGTDGTVYAYTRSGTTWTQAATIEDTSLGPSLFGFALAYDGVHLAVGAPLAPFSGATENGSVVIYTKGGMGYTQQKVLGGPLPIAGACFGHSLAFGGTRLAVGANGGVYDNYATLGLAYTYTVSGSTWTYEAGAQGSDAQATDGFGESVALGGTGATATLVVGAPGASPIASQSGAAYVFLWDSGSSTWLENAKLFPSDGAAGDKFGFTVAAISSTQIAVGAPGAGKVYLYTFAGSQTWNLTTTYASCPTSVGSNMASSGSLLLTGKVSDVVLDTSLVNASGACGGN